MSADETDRISEIRIEDDTALVPEAEQERNIAIFDLLEANVFRPCWQGAVAGPYTLRMGVRERQLILHVSGPGSPAHEIQLPFSSFRRRARTYFEMCDAYFEAVRLHDPETIRALDENRKALHNEGAAALRDRLAAEAEIDENTARRLFTLVASLCYRG